MSKNGFDNIINKQSITMEEWAERHIIHGWSTPIKDVYELLKMEFRIQPITKNDLVFTDEIEDDRVNCLLSLNDYDWCDYHYDTRFPTLKYGTLAVRFSYFGYVDCFMKIRQYLPNDLTELDKNWVLCHEYKFDYSMFNKYLKKDLESRVRNLSNSFSPAYSPEDLMIEFFNDVLQNGTEIEDCDQDISEPFAWESVRK